MIVRFTNYAACTGTWGTEAYNVPLVYPNPPESYPLWNQIHACMNGIYCLCYSIPIAAITDGTSNTIAFGEKANGLEQLTGRDGDERDNWCWWSDGATGDTLFHSLFPINPFKKVAPTVGVEGITTWLPVGLELPSRAERTSRSPTARSALSKIRSVAGSTIRPRAIPSA